MIHLSKKYLGKGWIMEPKAESKEGKTYLGLPSLLLVI